jgi:glycerol kinase
VEEASALGAVLMNGLALRRWDSLQLLSDMRETGEIIHPVRPAADTDALYRAWTQAVARTLSK